ncbi:MAG: fumarylacetoacetate hydrolase family protein, partial [Rhodospirillales bacterium]|nr:fumarylacetoacetate hydrolase family protein [Rhodospirillales bacterium]
GLEQVGAIVEAAEQATGGDKEKMHSDGALIALADAKLQAPIPKPDLIMSAGSNYGAHLKEMGDAAPPPHPFAFIKCAASVTGSGCPILVPAQCPSMVDYEGEFTVVFGRDCHNVSEEQAYDYVGGYTIVNDVSARDWIVDIRQAESNQEFLNGWFRNLMGKQLPSFSPMGPCVVTKDEISDPHDLDVSTMLNGETMQSSNTSDLIYGVPELVSYLSKWYKFSAGDMITTGSPPGVGIGRKPPVFMKPGDLVEVTLEGIGTLSNPLVQAG